MHPTEELSFSKDPVYHPLRDACDAVYKRLHSKVIGVETKATALLSRDQEDVLWDKGILSLDNPTGLLNAVFFYNGKKLLPERWIRTQKSEDVTIYKRTTTINGKEVSCYVYVEHGSKNTQGGLASLNQKKSKTVKQYEIESPRCHVKILDMYFEVLSHDLLENDTFYFQPNSEFASRSSKP